MRGVMAHHRFLGPADVHQNYRFCCAYCSENENHLDTCSTLIKSYSVWARNVLFFILPANQNAAPGPGQRNTAGRSDPPLGNHHRLAFIDTGQGLFNLFLNTSGMGLSLKNQSKAITIIGYNRFITCQGIFCRKKP